MVHPFKAADEVIAWVHETLSFGMKPGLQRMERLMEKLGHPERRLKSIHVAGTNGKGSTAAMIAHTLQLAGYEAGLFTSPYLENFTERIQVNGKEISEKDLVESANHIYPYIEDLKDTELGPATEFEIVTTIAIYYFAHVSCPFYVVWETGMGGRLDSTNVVHPVVSVITTIAKDHTRWLGDSLQKIAREKSGIIKPGVPVVTGDLPAEAKQVVAEVASQKKATLYRYGEQFHMEPVTAAKNKQTFHFRGPFRCYENVETSLMGSHQCHNAAVAIMTLEVLRQYMACIVEEEALYQGMSTTVWPGRLEFIQPNIDGNGILLDGAHNPHAAGALAQVLNEECHAWQQRSLVLGVLQEKDVLEMLRLLLPLAHRVFITEPDHPEKAKAQDVAMLARDMFPDLDIRVQPDGFQAVEEALQGAGSNELIVVTGSLYLIGQVRSRVKKVLSG